MRDLCYSKNQNKSTKRLQYLDKGKRTLRKLIFSWNKKTRQKQVNLPITKAHVEKRKSFPFGHLWRSFLTDNSADWEPRWLPEPLEWLTSPAPRKSENWYFVHIFLSSFPVKKWQILCYKNCCDVPWEKIVLKVSNSRKQFIFLQKPNKTHYPKHLLYSG